jgi:hypothetical protein
MRASSAGTAGVPEFIATERVAELVPEVAPKLVPGGVPAAGIWMSTRRLSMTVATGAAHS